MSMRALVHRTADAFAPGKGRLCALGLVHALLGRSSGEYQIAALDRLHPGQQVLQRRGARVSQRNRVHERCIAIDAVQRIAAAAGQRDATEACLEANDAVLQVGGFLGLAARGAGLCRGNREVGWAGGEGGEVGVEVSALDLAKAVVHGGDDVGQLLAAGFGQSHQFEKPRLRQALAREVGQVSGEGAGAGRGALMLCNSGFRYRMAD